MGDKNRKKKYKKLQVFDLSYFLGKSYFNYNKSQNDLIIQPMIKYFKTTPNDSTLLESKSKAFPNKIIKPPNIILAPSIVFHDARILVKFNRSC